jgi:hypothetical protein
MDRLAGWTLLALALAACPGSTGTLPRPDGLPPADSWRPPGSEGTTPPTDGTPPKQDGPAPDLCAPFAKEGASCAGGQLCPTGLIAAMLDGKSCTCQVPCNPTQSKLCAPTACGRVCVQLIDSTGQPLTGQGACVLDQGAGEGEPCQPAACKQSLTCVAHSAKAAFCRRSCAGAGDCPGYKMVCVPLTAGGPQVCVPGGATVGPKQGESCAGANDYCIQDLLCDPQSKLCRLACTPTGAPCASGSCSKLVDLAASVTIGYGCQ